MALPLSYFFICYEKCRQASTAVECTRFRLINSGDSFIVELMGGDLGGDWGTVLSNLRLGECGTVHASVPPIFREVVLSDVRNLGLRNFLPSPQTRRQVSAYGWADFDGRLALIYLSFGTTITWWCLCASSQISIVLCSKKNIDS